MTNRETDVTRFLDVRGLEPPSDSWESLYFVYHGHGIAGVIKREVASAFYTFTPRPSGSGNTSFASFSVEELKQQVDDWLHQGPDRSR